VWAPSLEDLLLPGLPYDYIDTPLTCIPHKELLDQASVVNQLQRDQAPLPTTKAREGYYGSHHLDYWLSGYWDVKQVAHALDGSIRENPHILDFGGSSGRIIRHFPTFYPGSNLFLSDINPQHIRLTRHLFGGSVRAFRNSSAATLPFPDNSFDLVVAFSVFTHLDTEDVTWLLELERITRKGGFLYVTIHDEHTWDQLSDTYVGNVSLQHSDFKAYFERNPALVEKFVHIYNDADVYNCNVFLPKTYLEDHWFPLFDSATIFPSVHGYQSAVALKVG
jgi:ubiquinone/menaquinone biosynthesis C-methylase UbiE